MSNKIRHDGFQPAKINSDRLLGHEVAPVAIEFAEVKHRMVVLKRLQLVAGFRERGHPAPCFVDGIPFSENMAKPNAKSVELKCRKQMSPSHRPPRARS